MQVVVIFSGGIDSTVCLAKAIKKYGNKNVCCLGFNYGQKNIRELECAKKIADYYDVNLDILDISNLFKYSDCSMLSTSSKEIPKITYDEQVKELKEDEDVSTNVPFRNGLLLSIACSYAISKNIKTVYYGIHMEAGVAYSFYPDCSKEFNRAINKAIYIGSGEKVKVEAPLVNFSKREIIGIGNYLKVPFELTWTCYEEGDKPCLECTACRDRILGFKENGMIDPLVGE